MEINGTVGFHLPGVRTRTRTRRSGAHSGIYRAIRRALRTRVSIYPRFRNVAMPPLVSGCSVKILFGNWLCVLAGGVDAEPYGTADGKYINSDSKRAKTILINPAEVDGLVFVFARTFMIYKPIDSDYILIQNALFVRRRTIRIYFIIDFVTGNAGLIILIVRRDKYCIIFLYSVCTVHSFSLWWSSDKYFKERERESKVDEKRKIRKLI